MTTYQRKTEEENKNGIKHSWPKGTCTVIGDSMFAGIDERKKCSKRLIKVRQFPGINKNRNSLNSRGLHLNSRDVLQFAKNLSESYCIRKKNHWNPAITIPNITIPNITKQFFGQ